MGHVIMGIRRVHKIAQLNGLLLLLACNGIMLSFIGCGPSDEIAKQIVALGDWRRNDSQQFNAVQVLVKIGKPAVDPLIVALKDKDSRARMCRSAVDPDQCPSRTQFWAAKALGEIKDADAVEPLITALRDTDCPLPLHYTWCQQVRSQVAAALGQITDPRAVEPLIATLMELPPALYQQLWWKRVIAAATEALVKFGSAAVEPLIASLRGTDSQVRLRVAEALGQIKDDGTIEPLIAALRDTDSQVRLVVTGVLVKIGRPAVEPLIAALRDTDPQVRLEATRTLGQIKDPSAMEPLIAALRDADPQVRLEATRALVQINDPGAVGPLIGTLKDTDVVFQLAATEALVKFGSVAVTPLIGAEKDEDFQVRLWAARALGEIKDAGAVEPLIAALRDNHSRVRSEAAAALGEIKDSRAFEPLIAALRDTDVGVQFAVTGALFKFGSVAIEPLIFGLSAMDSNVRSAAVDALAKMRDSRAVAALPALEIANAYLSFIRAGFAGSEDKLIEALQGFGSRAMAEDFLNSGNPRLEQTARSWATSRGYQILEDKRGTGHPRWGSG